MHMTFNAKSAERGLAYQKHKWTLPDPMVLSLDTALHLQERKGPTIVSRASTHDGLNVQVVIFMG